MTIQALIFLHQIKTVQQSELGTIWIDDEKKEMQTVIDEENCIPLKPKAISLKRKWQSVDSMTDYLQQEGLLEQPHRGYYFLTHQGYHYTQTVISSLLRFLLTSIAVPVAVAFLTTLITLWIQGSFIAT